MGIDLSAPDHTALSRRGQQLDVRLPRIRTGEATHLIVDSTGLSIVGEGGMIPKNASSPCESPSARDWADWTSPWHDEDTPPTRSWRGCATLT